VPVASLQVGDSQQTYSVILDASFTGLILQSVDCQKCKNKSQYEAPAPPEPKTSKQTTPTKPVLKSFAWTNNGLQL